MNSNFTRSWSIWGGRKRFDHKFNNSFDEEWEKPKIRLEDSSQSTSPVYERNKFQTRSLRFDRNNVISQNNYKYFNSSVNNELDPRQIAHKQWSHNIQKSLGFETLHSPKINDSNYQYAQQANKEHRRPLLQHDSNAVNIYNQPKDGQCEPIYENICSLRHNKQPLLPNPMDSPGCRPLHFPEQEAMEMTPELPPRNRSQIVENQNGGPQIMQKGGVRLNKAFQGVCTSMRTFSQRFRKKTKRHYQLDNSPCTPRMTPGKTMYPFDLSTPMTPHSYKRGTKRLQGSARRQLLGKENFGIARTPSHFHATRGNWANCSPMRVPEGRYRLN